MFKFVLIASLLVSVALAAPLNDEIDQEEKLRLEKEQNESAQYQFGSQVVDGINDGKIQREETREGTKVTGSYSYNDGFVERTVHYEADENGYRVVKEDMEVVGDGPVFNPQGQADVQGSLIGKYSIKLDQSDDKHYKDIRS
ncbi:larval cuticle protein A3A [Drosophila nasuta]|uniref:larval cuticle protein A3A n=1 Tax=Drosophila nasuta TaxID=42062 RepID=UPI00295EEEC9|nr:larval cuticle protein A3A [Drosophila nasuta]